MAHILVVDDEPLLLDLISATLRLDGHEVTAVGDPPAALSMQEAGQLPVDLLLTDVEMRPISGFELVRRLTKLGFDSPVLFTTGYPALSDVVAGSLGARFILEKPFTAAQLRGVVRNALSPSKSKIAVGVA